MFISFITLRSYKMIKQIKKINTTGQKFVYIDKDCDLEAGDYVLITKIDESKIKKEVVDDER